MAHSSSSPPIAASATSNSPPEPQPLPILFVYFALGSLISFWWGREPGTLPDDTLREIAPALIVVCCFLVSYSLWDVMAVGTAKIRCKVAENPHADVTANDYNGKLPEEVYLAIRVQTNQVEQMPVFLVGTLSCALFVNGNVAFIMSLMWFILRRRYATVYRNAVGKRFLDIGLGAYTIPAYFISNAMVMATCAQAIRCLFI